MEDRNWIQMAGNALEATEAQRIVCTGCVCKNNCFMEHFSGGSDGSQKVIEDASAFVQLCRKTICTKNKIEKELYLKAALASVNPTACAKRKFGHQTNYILGYALPGHKPMPACKLLFMSVYCVTDYCIRLLREAIVNGHSNPCRAFSDGSAVDEDTLRRLDSMVDIKETRKFLEPGDMSSMRIANNKFTMLVSRPL